ncbi:unnamed protein product [Nyctereutes procyonoides]|uniref:(raccoon dog) hypothetical protein n=1 Tax=Nyctereutes procyonoides TaxID=34880 RepID=A0A811ZMA5_NYCPR|nr:unnamed protein product [Nyctereutes procyonoides]
MSFQRGCLGGWRGCLGIGWMEKMRAIVLDLPKSGKDGTVCMCPPSSFPEPLIGELLELGFQEMNLAISWVGQAEEDWSGREEGSAEIGLSWEPSEERISCRRRLPMVSDAAESRLRPLGHVLALLAVGLLAWRGQWPTSLQSLPIALTAIALGDDGSAEHSCTPDTTICPVRVVPGWLIGQPAASPSWTMVSQGSPWLWEQEL